MKVKELKGILSEIPEDADIILAANGHYNYTDTVSHGDARAYHCDVNGKDVFIFSATSCGFDPLDLNIGKVKILKKFRG